MLVASHDHQRRPRVVLRVGAVDVNVLGWWDHRCLHDGGGGVRHQRRRAAGADDGR